MNRIKKVLLYHGVVAYLKPAILILAVGTLLRLALAFLPGFKIDTDAWFAWSIQLNKTGLDNFYSLQSWTNYTPGFLYVLYFLGYLKNILDIDTTSFYYLLKIPAILSECLIGLIIYRQILTVSNKWALIGLTLVMFNPAFMFNSSVWGQVDSLFTLGLLLSMIALANRRLIQSSIYLSLAFLVKPQAVFIVPVFFFFLVRNFSLQNLLKITVPILLVIYFLSVPFWGTNPFPGLINLIAHMVGDYPYTSLFAYNFWGLVGFWLPDSKRWLNLSYQQWGYLLLGSGWILIAYRFLKPKINWYILSVLSLLSFYYLPTRAHERYLYPALVFLILITAQKKSKSLLYLTGLLSLVHFLNLYRVYTYYNIIYLKLQPVLYNKLLYDFSANGWGWSLVSIIIVLEIYFITGKINENKA